MQVENARVRNTDGGTDGGGGDVEDQEHGPVTATQKPAVGAGPQDGGREPAFVVRPVDLTPGVEVLRAIAAEAPQWTVTKAVSLRDQGRTVTGMLETGFTPQEVRHAILSRPLPQPLRTSVAGVISGRLRHLIAIGLACGITPIPPTAGRHSRPGAPGGRGPGRDAHPGVLGAAARADGRGPRRPRPLPPLRRRRRPVPP